MIRGRGFLKGAFSPIVPTSICSVRQMCIAILITHTKRNTITTLIQSPAYCQCTKLCMY